MSLMVASSWGAIAVSEARAQGRTAEDLFREGREAARASDWERARSLFARSHALDPAPGTLLNLAEAEFRLGRLARALELFVQVASQLPPGDPRAAIARERQTELALRVPRLRVRLAPGAPPDTTVSRDGTAMTSAMIDRELPVDPGRHALVARAPGRREGRFEVKLAEGERRTIAVAPGPPLAGAPAAAALPAPSDSAGEGPKPPTEEGARPASTTLRTAGFVIGGVGVAALAAGVVTGLFAVDRKGAVEERCPRPHDCTDEGVAAAGEGSTFATVSTVAFLCGAAAAGAGVALVLIGGSPRGEPKRAVAMATLVPGGIALGGSF